MSYRKKHIHPKIKSLRKRKSFLKSYIFWICLVFSFFTITAIYIFFFSSLFKITNIVVSGNNSITSDELEITVRSNLKGIFGLPSKSILAVSTKKIQKELTQDFPAIRQLSVGRQFPNTITLDIEERKPVATVCFNGQQTDCFLVDGDGVIFQKTYDVANNLVLQKDNITGQVLLGEQIAPKATIDFILKVQASLRDNFQVDIQEVAVKNPMSIKTSEHWDLYFNPEGDTNAQLARMNTLLESEISEEKRNNLKYIYLQYGDKAYYQ